MAAIPLQQAARTYESQKLQEVFLPGDAAAPPPSPASSPPAPAPVSPRTRRFLAELNEVNASAIIFYLAGLIPIVLVAMLFF